MRVRIRLVSSDASTADGAGRSVRIVAGLETDSGFRLRWICSRPRNDGKICTPRMAGERTQDATFQGAAAAVAGSASRYASSGGQVQNTCLSPYTLSTRATGGQYFTCFSEASGYAASSRG